jgi:hypothetical protein
MLDRYDSVEFDCVEMMASSGGLSCPDSDARISYYQISGFPTLKFNGGNTIVGAGTDAVNGSVYDPVVQSLLDDPTPVALSITDHSFETGNAFIDVDITLEGDLPAGSNMKLRVAMLEDELLYGSTTYHNILRDMLPDIPLTISTAGQVQSEHITFTMDPTWVAAHLRAVVMVQDDTDKQIWQSCNTLPTPDYSLRYYAEGDRTRVGSGEQTFGTAGLFNTGASADTYTVSLDTSTMPADGSAHFLYDGTAYTSTTISLNPGERALLNVVLDTGTAFEGSATLVFHSESGQVDDRQLAYKLISAETDVLIVDDDGAYDYETLYFQPALGGTGKSSAIWDRNASRPSAEILANFDVVVWSCGWAFPTVDAGDRAALTEYLEGGGSLFITGQDIGWEMADEGASAVAWYNQYLHATYISDDTNDLTLDGVAGTFTEGLSLVIGGGDGANNQSYPSDIDPRGEFAQTILTYSTTRNGGIMADTGVYKVVYLAFGFEAIDNAADRAALMEGIIGFLAGGASPTPGDELPQAMALRGNTPNPFNPQTEIRFDLPADTRVKLEVYDLGGHLVRTLRHEVLPAGRNAVKWDGRDDQGRELSSGAYFYRLSGPVETLTGKMMLVR